MYCNRPCLFVCSICLWVRITIQPARRFESPLFHLSWNMLSETKENVIAILLLTNRTSLNVQFTAWNWSKGRRRLFRPERKTISDLFAVEVNTCKRKLLTVREFCWHIRARREAVLRCRTGERPDEPSRRSSVERCLEEVDRWRTHRPAGSLRRDLRPLYTVSVIVAGHQHFEFSIVPKKTKYWSHWWNCSLKKNDKIQDIVCGRMSNPLLAPRLHTVLQYIVGQKLTSFIFSRKMYQTSSTLRAQKVLFNT